MPALTHAQPYRLTLPWFWSQASIGGGRMTQRQVCAIRWGPKQGRILHAPKQKHTHPCKRG
eukprot:11324812-Alexandrium_andersonii.AAC.1